MLQDCLRRIDSDRGQTSRELDLDPDMLSVAMGFLEIGKWYHTPRVHMRESSCDFRETTMMIQRKKKRDSIGIAIQTLFVCITMRSFSRVQWYNSPDVSKRHHHNPSYKTNQDPNLIPKPHNLSQKNQINHRKLINPKWQTCTPETWTPARAPTKTPRSPQAWTPRTWPTDRASRLTRWLGRVARRRCRVISRVWMRLCRYNYPPALLLLLLLLLLLFVCWIIIDMSQRDSIETMNDDQRAKEANQESRARQRGSHMNVKDVPEEINTMI